MVAETTLIHRNFILQFHLCFMQSIQFLCFEHLLKFKSQNDFIPPSNVHVCVLIVVVFIRGSVVLRLYISEFSNSIAGASLPLNNAQTLVNEIDTLCDQNKAGSCIAIKQSRSCKHGVVKYDEKTTRILIILPFYLIMQTQTSCLDKLSK